MHLVVRDLAKGEAVAAQLRQRLGEAAPAQVWRCDLADLDDVRELADQLNQHLPQLDILMHNAGALPAQRQQSPQGHEQTMALHVLGPVLLTDLLLPLLKRAQRPARVLFITSGGMYTQRLRADDPEYLDGTYSGATAYARSKRAQVELLPILARRWAPTLVYATHPGWADTPGVSDSIPAFARLTAPILRDLQAGIDTSVWLSAIDPAQPTATLWHDRRRRPTHFLPTTTSAPGDVERLWQWVVEATGLELGHP